MMRLPRNMRRAIILASISALGSLSVGARPAEQHDRAATQETSPSLQRAISDAAKKYKVPGIAVALIEHGRLRAVEVFGVRDQKSGSPV